MSSIAYQAGIARPQQRQPVQFGMALPADILKQVQQTEAKIKAENLAGNVFNTLASLIENGVDYPLGYDNKVEGLAQLQGEQLFTTVRDLAHNLSTLEKTTSNGAEAIINLASTLLNPDDLNHSVYPTKLPADSSKIIESLHHEVDASKLTETWQNNYRGSASKLKDKVINALNKLDTQQARTLLLRLSTDPVEVPPEMANALYQKAYQHFDYAFPKAGGSVG
jgi:hypothetical protein